MMKRLGLLLVVLSLVAFVSGCSLFGGDDTTTTATSRTVEVNGALDTAPAPALGPNRALTAATDLAGELQNELGVAYASTVGSVTITGTNYKVSCVSGSTAYKVFVVFKHKTLGKILLKRYLGTIPVATSTTKVTLNNVNVNSASTAAALVAQSLLTSTSTAAATTTALNASLIPTGSTATTIDVATVVIPIATSLTNYVVNTATYTSVVALTNIVVSIMKNVAATSADISAVVPSLTSVSSAATMVSTINNSTASVAIKGFVTTEIPVSISIGGVVIANNATVAPVVTDATIASTVNTEATASANNGLKVYTVTADSVTVYPAPTTVPSIAKTASFAVNFKTVADAAVTAVALNSGWSMRIKVEETTSGTTITRYYSYPSVTASSTEFNFTDDFTTPSIVSNALTFGIKSSPVHVMNSGATYKITILSVTGVYNTVASKTYDLVYDATTPVYASVKVN